MSSSQFPSLVMIIRHGEKPGDPEKEGVGGVHLSVRGSSRAAALPALFTPNVNATPVSGVTQTACHVSADTATSFKGKYDATTVPAGQPIYPKPDFLFATEDSNGSHRPVETVTPLAQALGLTLNHGYTNNQHKALADAILKDPSTYGGKVVLICWHHGEIAKLVHDFGVPKPSSSQPWDPWPGTVFDLLLEVTWIGTAASVQVSHQELLFGDSVAQAATA